MNKSVLPVIKSLSNKCVLHIEYNNIGNFKKDIYFTNCNPAIDFLLQCKKQEKGFKLEIPNETDKTVVGFDCKEKRFKKLYIDLIHSVGLPHLDEFNPAAIQHCDLTKEEQEEILCAQAPILDNTVCKVETSKVAIDCPNLDYVINLENALKIMEISKHQIHTKNPRIVGRCKKAWLTKIEEHKSLILQYLEKEKATVENKEDIEFIIQKIESFNFKDALFNMQTPLEIAQYWPDILNPRPDFVLGFDSIKSEKETHKLALNKLLDFINGDMEFYKYRVFGFVKGNFAQHERAVALKETNEGLLFYSIPLDKNTVVSGEYGVSNVYLVYYLHLNKYEDKKYFFSANMLGNKEYDWWLTMGEEGSFEIKSDADEFEFKCVRTERVLDPHKLLKDSIVFENN